MPLTPDETNEQDDTVELDEAHVHDFIADRPLAALAIAFVAGFLVARTVF